MLGCGRVVQGARWCIRGIVTQALLEPVPTLNVNSLKEYTVFLFLLGGGETPKRPELCMHLQGWLVPKSYLKN